MSSSCCGNATHSATLSHHVSTHEHAHAMQLIARSFHTAVAAKRMGILQKWSETKRYALFRTILGNGSYGAPVWLRLSNYVVENIEHIGFTRSEKIWKFKFISGAPTTYLWTVNSAYHKTCSMCRCRLSQESRSQHPMTTDPTITGLQIPLFQDS